VTRGPSVRPLPGALLLAYHHNRAVGMAHHRVRDAAHHDQARLYILRDLHDLLGPVAFGYPKVLLRYRVVVGV
jgi:hypothetical protein